MKEFAWVFSYVKIAENGGRRGNQPRRNIAFKGSMLLSWFSKALTQDVAGHSSEIWGNISKSMGDSVDLFSHEVPKIMSFGKVSWKILRDSRDSEKILIGIFSWFRRFWWDSNEIPKVIHPSFKITMFFSIKLYIFEISMTFCVVWYTNHRYLKKFILILY